MPRLIAHRGSHSDAQENTLAACRAAVTDGADMVEVDVRCTADGELAIFHDPEVARRPLAGLSLAELRERSGTAVPVLTEVLAWATEADMGLDVELKEDSRLDSVAHLLSEFSGPLVVTSFQEPVLARLARLAPELRRGLLLCDTARGAVDRVRACAAHGAVIQMELLTLTAVEELAAAGLEVRLWDFMPDRAGHAAWLADPRVAGVITDDIPGTRLLLT